MRIDHKLQRVQIESFEISDELVYQYFNSLSENERESNRKKEAEASSVEKTGYPETL